MLTGMTGVSGGDAKIYGNSILTDIDAIQREIGLCQQFDILFNNLNCVEHLELVCEVKNIPKESIGDLIQNTLKVVMLEEHRYKLVN